jgi:hypothetical protein
MIPELIGGGTAAAFVVLLVIIFRRTLGSEGARATR